MNNQQFYQAPQADLSFQEEDNSIPDAIFSHLSTAGKWARTIAVVFYFFMSLSVLTMISTFGYIRANSVIIAIYILISIVGLILTFNLASSMNRYATAANYAISSKRIQQEKMAVDCVKECFEMMTRFTKNQVFCAIYAVFCTIARLIV